MSGLSSNSDFPTNDWVMAGRRGRAARPGPPSPPLSCRINRDMHTAVCGRGSDAPCCVLRMKKKGNQLSPRVSFKSPPSHPLSRQRGQKWASDTLQQLDRPDSAELIPSHHFPINPARQEGATRHLSSVGVGCPNRTPHHSILLGLLFS